jgi:hypothetical protein
MFSWFPLFRKVVVREQDNSALDDPLDVLTVSESNILVLAGRKNDREVARFLDKVLEKFKHGRTFSGSLERLERLETDEHLESYLLSHKAALESFDLPPQLLVLDRCNISGNSAYREIITRNKKLRLTTVTVVKNLMDLERNLIPKMDIVLLFKEKNRNRKSQESTLKSIWEYKYKERTSLENFNLCLMESLDNVGMFFASMITKEGVCKLKLGKEGTMTTRICSFKTGSAEKLSSSQ